MFLLVPAYTGSPRQKAVKQVCVCVCVLTLQITHGAKMVLNGGWCCRDCVWSTLYSWCVCVYVWLCVFLSAQLAISSCLSARRHSPQRLVPSL